MKRWLPFLLALPSAAHVISMSSGDLAIDGARAHYQLRMPLYEAAHVKDPGQTLLDHVRFQSAKLVSRRCREDQSTDSMICDADYVFASPVEQVEVECTLASVTVPSHVHLLRATSGGKRAESVFDLSFTHSTLRFREPGPWEVAATQTGAGLVRALGGPVQLLFLGALVLAARSRRELFSLLAMFIVGQCAGTLLTPLTGWQPAPRFVEAAAALTVAYLSVEMLVLPQAGARWLVAGVLGAFHGLWLLLFVQSTEYHAGFVLAGAAVGESLVVALLAWIASRVSAQRAVRVCASALLVFGLAWFWMGMKG